MLVAFFNELAGGGVMAVEEWCWWRVLVKMMLLENGLLLVTGD